MLNTLKIAAIAALCALFVAAEDKPAAKPSLADGDKVALLKVQVQVEGLDSQYHQAKLRLREQMEKLEAFYKAESERLKSEKQKILTKLQKPGYVLDETSLEYAAISDKKEK